MLLMKYFVLASNWKERVDARVGLNRLQYKILQFEHKICHWIGVGLAYLTVRLSHRTHTGQGQLTLLASWLSLLSLVSKAQLMWKATKTLQIYTKHGVHVLEVFVDLYWSSPSPTNKHNQGGTSGSTNKWLKYEMWGKQNRETRRCNSQNSDPHWTLHLCWGSYDRLPHD